MDFFTPYLPIYKNRQANRIAQAFFAWYMGIDLDKKRRFIMRIKLTALICFITCLHIYAAGYGQSITLSVKNASLQLVLDKIEKQSGYNLWVQTELLKKSNKVSLAVKNKPLDAVLKDVFKDQTLSYAIVGKTIVVKNKVEEQNNIFGGPLMVFVNIEGKIVDSKGAPLPGASVKVKGTTKATTANTEGKFSLVADKNDVLLISFVGYKTKEVPLNGQSTLTIQLEESAAELSDFVVVGYGSTKKVNLTGAVSTVSGDVLKDRPISNIAQGLQGVIPNLTITNFSGQPGRTSDLNIRGYESINGGSPLIVIDGVPTTSNSSLYSLNPQDVENITVLKDAASAAIYGGRATFGVILITTKSGKFNSGLNIEFSSNFSDKRLTELPNIVTDPATVMRVKNEGYKAYYGTDLYNQTFMDYANKRSADPSLPPYYIDPADPTKYVYVGSTNWFDELFRKNTPTWDNNLSIRGGTEKVTYNVSAGYLRQEGLFEGNPDVYSRYSLRSKTEFKATSWLKLGNTTQLSRTGYKYPTLWNGPSRGDLFHAIGRIPSFEIVNNPNGSYTANGVLLGYLNDGGRGESQKNDYLTTFEAQTNFFKNSLRVTTNYTFQSVNGNFLDPYIPLEYQYANPNVNIQDGQSGLGQGYNTSKYNVFNVFGEYEKNFGKHNVKAMAGYSQEGYHEDSNSIFRNDLISSNTPNIGLALGNPSYTSTAGEWALRSQFFRVNYAYDNKYLLEINGRRDGSSRFPVDDRYVFLPSGSIGWRVSEENFFKGLKPAISDFKLRFSYGSLGNQTVSKAGSSDPDYYPYIPLMSSSSKITNILGGNQPPAVYAPGLVSPSLTWERQYTKNWGTDIALMGNKLNISYDYYIRDVKDMLTSSRQLPAVLGTPPPRTNAADLRTRGWELALNYNNKFNLASSDFKYNFRFVLADNYTVITKFDNPNGNIGEYYVGKRIGEIWGMETEGLFQSDAEVAAHADQSAVDGYYGFHAGDPKYRDLNGDGKINIGKLTLGDHGDLKVIGNREARYTYGISGGFNWKGFDMSFFLQGVAKRDFWLGTSSYFWGTYRAPWEHVYQHQLDNMWSPENPDAYFPRYAAWRTGDIAEWRDLDVVQTRYLQDASYLRLKNLTIGYRLPEKLVKRIGLKSFRFYLSGENIGEINNIKFKVLDPETLGGDGSSSWGTGKSYPFQRSYSAGINVTL